jgi:NADH dehydrogenase
VHVVDLGHTLLGAFSEHAHDYVAKVLGRKGVQLHLGVAVSEVAADHVKLADGTLIRPGASSGAAESRPRRSPPAPAPQGRGGRVDVRDDLPSPASPGVFVLGDMANIAGAGRRGAARSWARWRCSPAPARGQRRRLPRGANGRAASTTTTRASWP